jgi:undecaprenyl-diphosphatase
MPLLHVIVLAIVQGLTEFLPVSSSAHLYLTSWILGWNIEALDFDIALHIGTLFAVLIHFCSDWVQIIMQGFKLGTAKDAELRQNPKLLWLLVIATIPAGITGLLFDKQAETDWRNPILIGSMLILVGILMWFADSTTLGARSLGAVHEMDAITIGLAQGLAVVPGTSRSGVTISAGLFRNLKRETAARFSFLLSTPTIAGAGLKALYDMYKHGGVESFTSTPFILGIVISAITGCAVIAWFLNYLRTSSLRPFIYYRIIFGIIVLALAFIRRPA